jgi:hypothetical protein
MRRRTAGGRRIVEDAEREDVAARASGAPDACSGDMCTVPTIAPCAVRSTVPSGDVVRRRGDARRAWSFA